MPEVEDLQGAPARRPVLHEEARPSLPWQNSEFSWFTAVRQTGRTPRDNRRLASKAPRISGVCPTVEIAFRLPHLGVLLQLTVVAYRKEDSVNKLLRSILRTAVYFVDQADNVTSDVRNRIVDQVDRVSDRVSDIADRSREMIYGRDHTTRHIGVFAAGFGVGIAAGLLFAPAPGYETRSSMRARVEGIGNRVRHRFSPDTRPRVTGTEGGI